MYVRFQTPGDASGDAVGLYRPERRGNLIATGCLLIGRGSWRQRATRVSPLANFEGLSHRETICCHHQMRGSSTSLKFQHPGGGNGDPAGRFRPARCGNPNPTGWLLSPGACAREEPIHFFEMSVLFETGELNAHVYDGGGVYRRKCV